jgi:hypothetical protein
LHVKICKLILGVVNNKATNNAARGELGSYPILITMLGSIKYWWKLNDKCMNGCKSLVIDALLENRKLCNTGLFSWSSGLKKTFDLIHRVDIWERPNIITPNSFNETIVSNLKSTYSTLWLNNITNFQTKLRSYCCFKKSFNSENYVVMFHRSLRAPFSKLRISAHSLMIEKGRHYTPKIEPQDRLCKLCNLNAVEDEFHFMMICPFYSDLRSKLLTDINEISDVDNLSDNEIFLFLMGATDYDCILPVIKFVKSAFESRISFDI